jgi:hypothetical protein
MWGAKETKSLIFHENENPLPQRPLPTDSYLIREKYIRAKYETKLFLARTWIPSFLRAKPGLASVLTTESDLVASLFQACTEDDVATAMFCLAHGADPNAIREWNDCDNKIDQITHKSPLHVAAENGAVACAVLLLYRATESVLTQNMNIDDMSLKSNTSSITSESYAENKNPGDLALAAGHLNLGMYIKAKLDFKRGVYVVTPMAEAPTEDNTTYSVKE